jgi:hypothetical protein
MILGWTTSEIALGEAAADTPAVSATHTTAATAVRTFVRIAPPRRDHVSSEPSRMETR